MADKCWLGSLSCCIHTHATEKHPVMSRSVSLIKGKNNMIGISIGGGAPLCPVLYVVQVSGTRIYHQLIGHHYVCLLYVVP